jgi:hypothetical protein
MHWIAPSEKDTDNAALEKRLWDAAEQAVPAPEFVEAEYAGARPEGRLGLIFPRFAEVIEPYHGRILETLRLANSRCANRGINRVKSRRVRGKSWPCASTSGGMFVQLARFVSEHKKNPAAVLSIHGVEKTDETGRLCRLNLAVHELEGEIKHGGNINSYYDDPHDDTGRFRMPQ